ncbi:hypothetical protein HMPREF3223_01486 [Cutibacterium avidum]|nr:hypothetical protein HMPREF3223_01486 [Cutibacterium avidum]
MMNDHSTRELVARLRVHGWQRVRDNCIEPEGGGISAEGSIAVFVE